MSFPSISNEHEDATLALRKKRPSPKSDAAEKFLRTFLSKGPKPVGDILEAARDNGISAHTLRALSQGIASNKPFVGSDGVRRSHWSLLPSAKYVSETPMAARKNSAAYKAGYEAAIADMKWRLASISSNARDSKSKEACLRLQDALNELKSGDQ